MRATTRRPAPQAPRLSRLFKTDAVRAIDRVIDYFGECCRPREPRAVPGGLRLCPVAHGRTRRQAV
jgi:hypothetical protein